MAIPMRVRLSRCWVEGLAYLMVVVRLAVFGRVLLPSHGQRGCPAHLRHPQQLRLCHRVNPKVLRKLRDRGGVRVVGCGAVATCDL